MITIFLCRLKQIKVTCTEDTTGSLLTDKIHLKPYFDYKNDNIVCLSDNSNKAAKVILLSLLTVFSQCKDVVHVM